MRRIIICLLVIGISSLGIGTAYGWGQETARNPGETKTTQTQKGLLGENVYGTIGLWSGYITGHSTSHTSKYVGASGIESELEFPLSNFFLGLEGVLAFRNPENVKQDRSRLTLAWFTNVDSDSGIMKDSDWLTNDLDIAEVGSAHPGLDIYSESDSGLGAHIIDLNAIHNFWPTERLSIGPMVGYRYQYFHFNIRDVNQVGYGPYAPDHTGSFSGDVGDVTHKYHIPYYGLNSDFLFRDTLHFNSRAAFTWAFASETDHHLLTGARYEGSCNGPGVLLNVNANWEFRPSWLLQLGGEYTHINADGTEDVYSQGVYVTQLDAEMDYSAWIMSAYLKYMF